MSQHLCVFIKHRTSGTYMYKGIMNNGPTTDVSKNVLPISQQQKWAIYYNNKNHSRPNHLSKELHIFYTSQTINNNMYHCWTIPPSQTNIEKFQETLIYAPLVSCSLRSERWSPSRRQGFFWFVTQVERMWITKWCTG